MISQYLTNRNQIWSTNQRYLGYLFGIGGQYLTPKQAGSNEHQHHPMATMIYTSKPSKEDRNVLEAIGIDPMVWTETHELETILQFACRTSVRDPNSTESLTFTVYDATQARFLADYFSALDHCEVEISHIDLGFTKPERKKPGRKRITRTPEERRRYERERKRAQRAKKDTKKPQ